MNKLNKLGKSKLIVFFLAVGLLATTGYAAWLLYLNPSYTAFVVGDDKNLQIDLDFSDIMLNTSGATENVTEFTSSKIFNPDGVVELEFDSVITKIANNENCLDIDDDCTISNFYNGTNLNSGDFINITEGYTFLNSSVTCDYRSCPANVSVVLMLTG